MKVRCRIGDSMKKAKITISIIVILIIATLLTLPRISFKPSKNSFSNSSFSTPSFSA